MGVLREELGIDFFFFFFFKKRVQEAALSQVAISVA